MEFAVNHKSTIRKHVDYSVLFQSKNEQKQLRKNIIIFQNI